MQYSISLSCRHTVQVIQETRPKLACPGLVSVRLVRRISRGAGGGTDYRRGLSGPLTPAPPRPSAPPALISGEDAILVARRGPPGCGRAAAYCDWRGGAAHPRHVGCESLGHRVPSPVPSPVRREASMPSSSLLIPRA